jgi:hypothetical protein
MRRCFMKTILSGAGLCCAAIAVACCSDTARADTWSCEQNIADKAVKRVWVVSGNRLTAPNDDNRYRIIRNDERVLIAFHKDWEYKIGGGTPLVAYIIIDKATGALIDLNDSVLTTLGAEYKDTATPDAALGHCTLSQP